MDFYTGFRSQIDSGEVCCLCLKFFPVGRIVARAESGKVAHYKCAKKAGWRSRSRAKPKPVEHREQVIRLVRSGEVIKSVTK